MKVKEHCAILCFGDGRVVRLSAILGPLQEPGSSDEEQPGSETTMGSLLFRGDDEVLQYTAKALRFSKVEDGRAWDRDLAGWSCKAVWVAGVLLQGSLFGLRTRAPVWGSTPCCVDLLRPTR